MNQTSNFLALQAVIEMLQIFFKMGVDISHFLHESLDFLTGAFTLLPDDQLCMSYHYELSNITRKVICDVLLEGSIKVVKLIGEKFINNFIPSGRDLFLYLNKTENILGHLVVFTTEDMYLERISLEAVTIDKACNSISTAHWTFTLESKDDLQYLADIIELIDKNAGSMEVVRDDFELKKAFKPQTVQRDDDNIDGNIEQYLSDKDLMQEDIADEEAENDECDAGDSELKRAFKPQTDQRDDDNLDEDIEQNLSDIDHMQEDIADEEAENDECDAGDSLSIIEADIETGFRLKKEDIKDYWQAESRRFSRETCGRDWPMMYGSPCAIIISYDRAQVFNSRKKKVPFAKLTGKCSICKSKVHYVIKENPFEETLLNDGTIKYDPVADIIVRVKAHGKFHPIEGLKDEPNIKKPFHQKENAKGLQLRGEERRLIGLKAAQEGAFSVYKQGMAYQQREQIESYNRTSIRSAPVIR